MRGLYAIVDVSTLAARRLDPLEFTRAVLSVRPAALQVRAKDLPTREFLTLLRSVAPLCRAAGVPLVANDRVDLAALAGCDYVHLGQEDLPIELVRRIAPNLRVGVSTHTPEQLERALLARPTYVAYGPVYPTGSKAQPDACVGIAGLRAAAFLAAAARIPLVAIGGITVERAREVAPFSDAAAVIAALLPPPTTDVATPRPAAAPPGIQLTDARDARSVVFAQVASRARQLQAVLEAGRAGEARA
jgi:thiamine-phosphate pyrophosphorylase